MNIQRDEIWITRGGEEVRIICVDAESTQPIISLKGESIKFYYPNGQFYSDSDSRHDLTHKKPVTKQIKLEAWIDTSRKLSHYEARTVEGYDRKFGWTRVPNLDLVAEVE